MIKTINQEPLLALLGMIVRIRLLILALGGLMGRMALPVRQRGVV